MSASGTPAFERATFWVQAGFGVILAVATALMGITVPSLWSMSKDIGKIEGQISDFGRRFDGINKQLDGIDARLDAIDKKVDAIDVRLSARETDPSTLVAKRV